LENGEHLKKYHLQPGITGFRTRTSSFSHSL
jgi:hypothetical protein